MEEQFKVITSTPISELNGIGDKTLERLNKINIKTVYDLLFHFPTRYEDKTKVTDIASLVGSENARVNAEVCSTNIRGGYKKTFIATVKDATGEVELCFFRYSKNLMSLFKPGAKITAYGRVQHDNFGLKIIQPICEEKKSCSLNKTQYLTPIYPLTEGVKQNSMQKYIKSALKLVSGLPDQKISCDGIDYGFLEILNFIHSPPNTENINELNNYETPRQRGLVIDELLAYSVNLMSIKSQSLKDKGEEIPLAVTSRKTLLDSLPFEPTNAQLRVISEIDFDMTSGHPMMRLVQGDVGSGKTLVAAFSVLNAVKSGFQVAMMAPTEILAEQHIEGMREFLSPLGVRIEGLTGKTSSKERADIIERLKVGEIDFLVGTHAIFQEDVVYANLALIIVDEQHKFGVHQRLALVDKGKKDGYAPHQLVMTATPIPRTLALIAYAGLDVSVIDELPPGRVPIKTVVISQLKRNDILARIKEVCKKEKKQVYWVCTLIDESELNKSEAATETYQHLTDMLSDIRVGLVHGKLKSNEKRDVVNRFKAGEIDVLVATTVIEVGVNVPNASLMVIENPERLGLAQLHQLRGRVGRGSKESSCVLLYGTPLSSEGMARLEAMRQISDGFELSKRDLELRGAGEMLGAKQAGAISFKIADLEKDNILLGALNKKALCLLKNSPNEVKSLSNRWGLELEKYSVV